MLYDKPQLRYVEAIPVQEEGETIVIIRDPESLFGQPLAVPLPTFFLMSFLDGTRDLRDVQAEVQRQFQQLVPTELLEGLVAQLDEAYLLDNERSKIRRDDLEREFERLPSRPAVHAGVAYPEDPEELVTTFDGFLAAANAEANGAADGRPAPRGLVTPHIDIRQGGPCMASAFRLLAGEEPPTCYIILGVAHHPARNLFTLSTKDFETPLGPARVNQKAAARLQELYGADALKGEFAHKNEHSVEFQTVFLKYIHRLGHDFTILPILCGSIDEDLHEDGSTLGRRREEVHRFCEALKTLLGELGPGACVIAGVDLSHVGKKFGDPNGVDDLRAGLVHAADQRMLENVRRRNAEEFFDHFRPDKNARNVDAVTAVYTLLRTLGPGEAELLAYDQFRETETESMVTYASMALY